MQNNYIIQFTLGGEDDVITKVARAKEVVEKYGYSDFNEICDMKVFLANNIGEFIPCSIVRDHNEVIDNFGHIDIWCNIVIATTGEVLDSASYEDH